MTFDENPESTGGADTAAEWESVIDDARAEPREGIADLVRIVAEELTELGYDVDRPSAASDLDPELALVLGRAREAQERIGSDEEPPRDELTEIVRELTELHEGLERPRADAPITDAAARDSMEADQAAGDLGEQEPD